MSETWGTMSDDEVEAYVRRNGLDRLIPFEGATSALGLYENIEPANKTPLAAQWRDLARLHDLVRRRKVTTVLEFGVGKSTLVLAHALAANESDHGDDVTANLRRANPFELHCIDDMQEYIDITAGNLPEALRERVTLHFSRCAMASFNGRICTLYDTLPDLCPDFIYLDAPSQYSVTGDVRGISTRHKDRLPMAADLLAIEHFLLPGTLILVDGRTANARFLRCNFQRNWSYAHLEDGDVHLFELVERPLGKHNRRQIEYCLGPDWLEALAD